MRKHHHWKNTSITNTIVQSVCVFCDCERLTQHSKQLNRFHTSYRQAGTIEYLRTAPICIDKINTELPFTEKEVDHAR